MKVERVRFADVLTERVPLIVEPERPEDQPIEFMGVRFAPSVDMWLRQGRVYVAGPWSRWVVSPPMPPCPYWNDLILPGPGDPYFPVVASPLVEDFEVGWWPSTYAEVTRSPFMAWSAVQSPHSWDVPVTLTMPNLPRSFSISMREAAAAFWSRAFAAGAAWNAEVYDDLSAVESNANDTIKTLVELAREGKREDFDFLAAASGVQAGQREELWSGTRKRLHKEVAP